MVNNVAPAVPSSDDGRKQPRTHLFVAATLYSGSASTPAHVRNMSPCGALIESMAIPEPGAKVVLKRGGLQAAGRIAWKVDRRAGVAFETNIFVADWMARHATPQQQRIDEVVSSFRSGGEPGTTSRASNAFGEASFEDELMLLRTMLSELEASLVGDSILVATHPEIQVLDISLQRIDRMIAKLRPARNS